MIFVFDRVETIIGKGENDGNKHLQVLYPQCFLSYLRQSLYGSCITYCLHDDTFNLNQAFCSVKGLNGTFAKLFWRIGDSDLDQFHSHLASEYCFDDIFDR